MLLAGLPQDDFARSDRLTLTVPAADPPGAANDREQLRHYRRMPRDDTSGPDLDHDDVSLSSQPAHSRTDAPRRRDLALALELDPPHTRSITDAIAWPKPMHIVATPYRASRRSSSLTSVAVMRAPVAPSG
jgi:hypothetical protein